MKKLSIEIADTPSRRATGLMHRKDLDEDAGMLFKFPRHEHLSFWMKSTYIPLEIAFMNDEGRILQISEMYPLSTRRVSSDSPCKLALEVNNGWFDKNDIGVGDIIGGLDIGKKTYRSAQVNQMPPHMQPQGQEPQGQVPQDPMGQTPPEEADPQQDPQQEQQTSPRAEMILDDRAKVRYAEQHNYALQIVYQSKRSGQTLPPRKLLPISGDGYATGVSEGGDYFTAFDSSPTINGGDWQILGNQIKRFLFSNIIALEVIEEFVQ